MPKPKLIAKPPRLPEPEVVEDGFDAEKMAKMNDEMLDRLQKRLSAKIKSSSFFRLEDPNVPTRLKQVIRSGIPSFDLICARTSKGMSGLPIGRQMEISGPNSSGKTSLACALAAAYQKAGWIVKWIEAENKLSPSRARIIGLDDSKVLFSQPECFEDTYETVDETMAEVPERNSLPKELRNHVGVVIVVDSVASMPTRAEIEGDIEDAKIASFARQMSAAQRRITNKLSKRNVSIIWINQNRDKIGMGPFARGGKTTYGGNALPYYCAQRWELWAQRGKGRHAGKGVLVHIVNKKNQTGAHPFLEAEVFLDFEKGFDYIGSWLDAMCQLSIAQRSANGQSYEFLEGPAKGSKFQARKLEDMYQENPKWFYDYEKITKDFLANYHTLGKEKKDAGAEE